VAKPEDAPDADFEQASEKLSKGLKTCRTVVENYRHMLTGEEAAAAEKTESETPEDQRGAHQTP
jgi:hypothetical protein